MKTERTVAKEFPLQRRKQKNRFSHRSSKKKIFSQISPYKHKLFNKLLTLLSK